MRLIISKHIYNKHYSCMASEFWEDKHKNQQLYWLTNSPWDQYMHYHKLPPLKDCDVLEIGVGFGTALKELSRNNRVIGVDISHTALKNIEGFAETHHISSLKNIRPVDVAIAHLVFQHCTDDVIKDIINNVQLKDDGYFTFQFASLKDATPNKVLRKKMASENMHHLRSLGKILSIVENTNKKVFFISDKITFSTSVHDYENLIWHTIKVKNKIN